MSTTHKKYSDPTHPEHKEWLTARRERFRWLLKAAKGSCKLTPDEKELVTKLRKLVAENNEKIGSG